MNFFEKCKKITINQNILPLIIFFSFCFTPDLFALAVNGSAPDFTLLNLDGGKVSLRDFRGRMVILKLGTTWCPGCRDQSRELKTIDPLIREKGIVLIEVFLDDPVDEIKRYQEDHVMQSRVATLLGDSQLMRDYAIYAIPRLIILSVDQKVLVDSTGMTAEQIKNKILQSRKG